MTEALRIRLTVIILVSVLTGYGVWSTEVIRTDPGHNVTITWEIEYPPFVDIDEVEIQHIRAGHRVEHFYCFIPPECIDRSRYARLGVAAIPPLDYSDRYALDHPRMTHFGFFIKDITLSDFGRYEFHADLRFDRMDKNVTLYVYKSPSKPVITSRMLNGEINLTCRSTIQSLPEEYRNSSHLEYTWSLLLNSEINYKLHDNEIRIMNPQRSNHGSLFYCTSNEVNSTLVSQVSDPFLLNVTYLEDIQVIIKSPGDDPENLSLSCSAACNPECTYTWTNSKGEVIGRDQQLFLGNTADMDPVTCQAKNMLGTLSQKTATMFNSGKHYKDNVVISLSVFLVLTSVTLTSGVGWILYKRRQKQESRGDTGDRSGPVTVDKRNDALYVNVAFRREASTKDDLTYDQLGTSRDSRPEPSSYEVICKTQQNLGSNVSHDVTDAVYEQV